MRRTVWGWAVACALAWSGWPAVTAASEGLSLRLIGSFEIPSGTLIDGVAFGGISAIDLGPDGLYYALSDHRGGGGFAPRFYLLDLDFDTEGFHGARVIERREMRRPDGAPFPGDTPSVDPEGLRVAQDGKVYWSSEGNFSQATEEIFQPFLREMTPEGVHLRDFEVPGHYQYHDNATRGARSNKLFEALAVGPDGAVHVANEDAILQDGPGTTLEAGSLLRVTRFDAVTGRAVGQFVYGLPPVPVDATPLAPFGPDNGLAGLLALGDGGFLALERAFAWGVGNTIRITRTAILPETTDVLGYETLVGADFTPMPRELVLEMGPDFEGVRMDNMEGMSWGPDLPNGNASLVLVSDDNFNSSQRTLFMAFEVSGLGES